MLEEKAIKRLTAFKNLEIMYSNKLGITIDKVSLLQEDIETVLNTLKEKDKIIEAMAERIEWLAKSNGILLDKEHDENFTQEDIIQYFANKVNSSEQ